MYHQYEYCEADEAALFQVKQCGQERELKNLTNNKEIFNVESRSYR
jgi:hypothetical protein